MSTYYKNPNGGMLRILLLSFPALLFLIVFVLPATATDGSSAAVTDAQLMDLNVPFIANSGQQPAEVKFYADTFYGRVFVTNVDLTHAVEASTDDGVRGVALKEQFVATNDTVISFIPAGEDPAETKVSYFIGNDASTWQTGLPAYNLVSLGEIWPGITVKAQAYGATVEKLFTVAPGASPETICVKVQGADSLRIADDGSLVIVTSDGEISLTEPRAYQDGKDVVVAYRVLDEGTYGFAVGEYNRTKVLVIDPSLAYSTYLGGSDRDLGYSIAADTNGSAYVGGYTYSTNFPTVTGAYQTTYGSGTSDAFVTKLNPDGSGLAYSTYLGGSLVDQVYGIAVDSSGNAYIAGYTTSSDFPTTVGAYNRTLSGSQDGIVVKLNPSGTSLLYSTYLGGAAVVYSSQGQEEIDGITVDSTGKIYVTGRTGASDFPVTAGAYNTTMPHTTGGSLFGFISIIDPAGSGTGDLTYSTYLGGDMGTHYSRAIVLDSAGMIYVDGQTTSDVFPVTTGAFQTTKQCAGDNYNGFMSKINPAGSGTGDLVYSTYLGGTNGPTYPRGIGVDSAGMVYVAGYTTGTDFPTTTGAYQTTNAGGNDAFICTINPAGSGTGDLGYSTYLGGTGADYGYGSALDSSGTVYLTGATQSPDFPATADAYQTSLSGTRDVFVANINPAGSGMGDLIYSTYFGGTGSDTGYSVTLDGADNAYVAGYTASTDFPVTHGAYQGTYGGGSYDVFVSKFALASAPVPPAAEFNGAPTSGTAPLTVLFTDASTGTPTSWAWDFTNDGTIDSTEQNPEHIYDTAGTYTVNLTVTNGAGSDSELKTDYITVTAAGPKTWYVDDSGGADFTTIQAAEDAATDGDTIIVRDGTYVENVVVEKSLIIQSENGRDVTIVQAANTALNVFNLSAPSVTIRGFTATGASGSSSTAGILAGSASNSYAYTITDNNCSGNGRGIYVPDSTNAVIANNICNYNRYGILLVKTSNGIITENTCSYNLEDGISISNGFNQATISKNQCSGNRRGIYAKKGTTSTITQNTCSNNTIDGIHLWDGMEITISNNILSENINSGLHLQTSASNNITENTLSDNQYGIQLQGSPNANTNNNVVYLNNFKENTGAHIGIISDTYIIGNIWNSKSPMDYSYNSAPINGYMGNYWSGYSGVDADGNGIGDTPYQTRATPDEYDSYPLMGAWNNGEITYTPPAVIAPVAAFTSDVQSGTTPLIVNFTDASTGTPTSWAWDFDNDGVVDSTEQSPSHIYDTAGTYTVNLTVTNAGGSNSEVKTDYITVSSSGSITVPILLDYTTDVTSGDPTQATGNSIEVLVVSSTEPDMGNFRTYVHANLNQIPSGAAILNAKLKMRVYYMQGKSGDHDVHRVNDPWSDISWNTQPSFQSSPTDSKPTSVNINDWISWDVTSDIQAFKSGVPNYGWVVKYSIENSPEPEYPGIIYYGCANDYEPGVQPYLEVTYTEGSATVPTANFTADVTSGNAPLTVHFTDASTGTPTSWAWDFTNDGTVDSAEPSPSYIYDMAGTFTVNLTVTNAGGSDSEVKTNYITVTAAGPKTWYVDDSGGADFTTIQAAVNAASDGDTIIVRDGTYIENVVVGKSLIIQSENGRDAVIVQAANPAINVFTLSAPSVTIRGFTCSGATGTTTAGILAGSAANSYTYNITDNYCTGNGRGIYIPNSTNSIITNNICNNNRIGILLDSSSHVLITENTCSQNVGEGIKINTMANDAVISKNHCSGNNRGIYAFKVTMSTITENICLNNGDTGMHVQEGMQNNISKNNLSGNTLSGILLYKTMSNIITQNSLSNNQYGIQLRSSVSATSTLNVIYLNNFEGNSGAHIGLYSSTANTGNIWNSQTDVSYSYDGAPYTGLAGNHWGGYSGSDTDGNGIGDTPYQTRATPDEFDNYPLIGEWNNGEITYTPPAVIAPVAAFTSDVQTGTAPLTVNFTDQSTNTSTSWAWDVNNDGTVDYTTQNATHIFTIAGNYTINLTVTNAVGSDDEVKTDYITVTPPVPAILWGPYLTGTTTTGTVVNVKTNIATAITVEYATDAFYTANAAYDQNATDGVVDMFHHISLAGLTPDTLYHYRVVYAGQQTTDFHVSTFPESGAFTFVMYSDTQDQLPTYSQLERHKVVADRIAEEPDIAFVLNSGDLVNDASDLANWDRYFAAGSMMMANTTVYPALGNHDNNDPNYFANYGVPEYYSFDCGDGHIAVLNSNDWAWNDLPVQSAWLANDLQTDKPFKFTAFHHPLYTSEAKHFGGWENLRLEWEDDFIDNGVLAVFNGHVHAYERFLVNDITYFVAGIGGGPSYYLQSPRYTGSQNSLEGMLGYIKVTVDPAAGTATAQVIRVADVLPDNSVSTYPPGTVFETVVMSLPELPVAPTAAFTSDVTSGAAPLTVQFTDQSTGGGITTWAWDFDNDGTVDSTGQSPSHIYDMAGTYTVNLTVTNAAGRDSEVKTEYITATEPAQLRVLNVNTGVRYATIQAAVNAATAGDTLVVSDGAFTENIDVDKQLTIRSENGVSAVTVTAASPTLPVFDVNANGVSIQGFTVRGPTNEHVAGIEIVDYNDCLVIENDCAGCYNGIHLGGTATNNTVEANYCHGNTKRGISVRDMAHDNLITLNTAGSNTDAGICIKDQTYNNVLWLNDVIGNRVEILTENIAHSPNPITYTYNGGTFTSYLGNYYFDYSGADSDGNGVGTPAYSYGTYGDGYPLMGQYANYVETTPIALTAVFTADVTSGTAPLTVQFTDASTGTPTSWAWDFNNDGTVDSTAQSPSHTYSTVGSYTVKLTVTNTAGSDDEVKTDYISVSSAGSVPVAAYSGTPTSGTAPLTVHFTDASTGTPTTWAWDFTNDGIIDSTVQSPSHIYDTAGTYSVNLTVTNAAGSDSEVKTGYITVSSPSSGTALLIRPAAPSVIVGGTRTVNIVLSEAADGLAGYNITISLADRTKAEISAVSFPGWAGVNQQSTVPGDSIWMKGLDLNKQVEAGASEIILATLTIRGDQLGVTALRAEATVMDDDDGTAMDPVAAEESLSVIQQVPQLPGYPAPTDPDGDGLYEDLNGNGRIDFNDVVVYFNNMEWISVQDGFGYFDFNRNGRIDFDDVVRLFWGV